MTPHLNVRQEALPPHEKDLTTLCGRVIQLPRIAFLWDEMQMGELDFNRLKICSNCLLYLESAANRERQYVYGIVEEQNG